MFDANTANRRERIDFIQNGCAENALIATVSGIVFAALVVGHLAGVL